MKSKPEPAAAAPTTDAVAQALSDTAVETLKSLSSLSLPMPSLAQLQNDYVQQATALWNQSMQQFQALGDREDYNEVIDGVMRQLLSKDLMYEPIKQICQKFPEWLAINKYNLILVL